jgi:branched-chain amino acid aminotransferase
MSVESCFCEGEFLMTDQAHPAFVWHDGKLVPWDEATVHLTWLGPSSVSSVFEGIRGYWNEQQKRLYIFRLDAHLARFAQSIRLIRMTLPFTREELREAILALLHANGIAHDVYVRPFAYSEAGAFGSPPDARALVLISTSNWNSKLHERRPNHAMVSSWTRIADNVMPPRIKASSNYLNSRYAGEEARRNGYDYAIILNSSGKVAEGPGACLVLVRGKKLITPGVTSGILESITREVIIQLARERLGLEVVERTVDRTELYVADEVFFCGTSAEIAPIVSVDRLPVGAGEVGPFTHQLIDCYHDIVRGIDPGYPEWRTPA